MASDTTYQSKIGETVRKLENEYTNGSSTKLSKYVDFNMFEILEKIDAYSNFKHISGDTDSMGREKPFFDISTGATNIWYRATDIDRKNIRIKSTKAKQLIASYLATVKLQRWMKDENFGAFLNEWGRILARYGSAVLKFVESEGKLHKMVVSWNRLIVDQIDFDANIVIEKLEFTPAQLLKRKGYDKEIVKKLIDAVAVRRTLDKQEVDTKPDYITLYEVHGEMKKSELTGKETDEDEYVQQMHVISYVESKEKGKYDDFCLVKGQEEKDPYMITHLIKEDGKTLAIGAVQSLFEAQWMQNHSAKQIKDHLDLASKLIFQTSDGNFVGQNALTAIENGDILVHAINQPLTQINNGSHDISSMQSFQNQWKALAQEITSTPDAISGSNFPSGTAYRQVAILNQEAHSLFEIMTENKGIHIEEMMRIYILPFLKKQLDTPDEIMATLDEYGINQIDAQFIKVETDKRVKEEIKSSLMQGEVPVGLDPMKTEQDVRQELSSLGGKRFYKPSEIEDKTWKDIFHDFEWDVEVEVTNENTDKEVTLSTLSTVLQTIATNPAILQDPNAKFIFNKILEESGKISPVELEETKSVTPPAPVVTTPQLTT